MVTRDKNFYRGLTDTMAIIGYNWESWPRNISKIFTTVLGALLGNILSFASLLHLVNYQLLSTSPSKLLYLSVFHILQCYTQGQATIIS